MEYHTAYKSVVFMGKIASGKGTQANLVLSHFGGVLYSNGNKLREVATMPTVFGQKMKEVYEGGALLPELIASYWMTHALVSQYVDDLIVFEAVAKKPKEAELFHEIHKTLGRSYIVFHISVSDDIVRERSMRRARDIVDSPESVERRLAEYNLHTAKSVEVFRSYGTLVELDGNASLDTVKDEVFRHLMV